MTPRNSRVQSRPLDEYSRTITSEGISVRAKCYLISDGRRDRYELLLDAAGQRAMVDLGALNPTRFSTHIEMAAKGFAASLAVQLGESKRL